MGVYASLFYKNEGQILTDLTDPSQFNWITAHAEACKLTVPEVQRCWSRFLMLQPDQKGNVSRAQFCSTANVFGQKLLEQIPCTEKDQITFQSYCNAVSWLSKSPLEAKLRGLYQILTSGTISKEQLRSLMHNLYPREGPQTTDELATLFLNEVDKSNRGYIDEDQFLAWVKTLPQQTLMSVLHFPIIPSNITHLKEQEPSFPSTAVHFKDRSHLCDRQLLQVATEMSSKRRDWRLLANSLGFLEKDCSRLEHEHSEVKSQILALLQIWQKMSQEAPLPVLQTALRQSGNADICNEVFSLNF
ncbi:uncharacterized protein LOC109283970 [Alligator mississippiensis]|uniref:Death domain-containing protein n=1 Tax=Alligator mississippiensis TaxID=8496 RepID=A0A151NEM9_ALLMI|nr:uncharacterized protein LOC109283970 [Alligator mississippiensis]KYO35089.1 hypothetical protein Y1Q_0000980 [Alligator mississippiensis]